MRLQAVSGAAMLTGGNAPFHGFPMAGRINVQDDSIAPKKGRARAGVDVADWLRERIRKGRFVPGQRLVEADITGETGAGRTKVREALQRLEAEGLVIIEEYRGASVRRTTMEEVRQIYRARSALEGICAADFARDGAADQKRLLEQLQQELDACVDRREAEQFGRTNREWHNLIVAGSGNMVVSDMLQRLNVPIHRLLFESFYNAERLKAANADHKVITAAILKGDAGTAEAAMRQHITDGFGTLSEIDSEFHS
jgi:DNA-binding GntR family transcriptional regulator